MGWTDALKGIVKTVAPTIGTALGGPAGGMATKFLAEKLLGKSDATEEDIEQSILGASPETMLQLKKLDRDFEMQMKQLGVDVFKLEVEDRKSARDMFKVNIWPQISLSGIFTIGYFVVLYQILSGAARIAPEMEPVANVIIGVLTAAMTTILAFWFGSSFGSKEKTHGLLGGKL